MKNLILIAALLGLTACGNSSGNNIIQQHTFVSVYSSCNMPPTTLKLSKLALEKHFESDFNLEQKHDDKQCTYVGFGIMDITATLLTSRFVQPTRSNTCKETDLIWDKNYSYSFDGEQLRLTGDSGCNVVFNRVAE